MIKPDITSGIPENLIADVKILKVQKDSAVTLPAKAVLTNETQSSYWIMKLINDTTAVRVPIRKGLESGNRIEILKPQLKPDDRIVLEGAYGLGDTALVKISPR